MNAFRKWADLLLFSVLWLAASWSLMSLELIKFENFENWLEILVAAVALTILIEVVKRLKGWSDKLDKIINKSPDKDGVITITVQELPTAAEIVRAPANHPLLKEKLEQLKYLLLSGQLEEKSWELLKRFIENCERGLAKAERDKQARRIPYWAWIRLFGVAVLWLTASLAPMAVDYLLSSPQRNGTDSSGIITRTRTTQQGPSTNSQSTTGTGEAGKNRVAAVFNFRELSLKLNSDSKSLDDKQPAAWLRILISVAVIFIYLAFYAVLTAALFKMAKHLRQYYRQKNLHEDLSPLAALLAVRIDPADTARQQLKDRIVRTLLSDDSEE